MEAKFDEMLSKDQVDIPSDFYEEKLFREDDPSFLNEVFQNLEDKNLDIISKVGDSELVLDNYKNDFKKMQREYGNEIATLE